MKKIFLVLVLLISTNYAFSEINYAEVKIPNKKFVTGDFVNLSLTEPAKKTEYSFDFDLDKKSTITAILPFQDGFLIKLGTIDYFAKKGSVFYSYQHFYDKSLVNSYDIFSGHIRKACSVKIVDIGPNFFELEYTILEK